ncbi:hypothetical protein [Chenggangzhangella methanolivorans]|uniref:hypothetical protein n=1 Tax=Chenggangzhangella methanolivorans TaxID=1437009 RepID=UPI0028F3F52F|nr:hypothetical protein [Chenggangzhangella methanolivorans]
MTIIIASGHIRIEKGDMPDDGVLSEALCIVDDPASAGAGRATPPEQFGQAAIFVVGALM